LAGTETAGGGNLVALPADANRDEWLMLLEATEPKVVAGGSLRLSPAM
jgi:hypothetical protein